ncbi:MAG: sporulation protein [Bacillota bacterium]|nr:sporulation protein [Bacillota bacterium]MDP4171480.1 sporulation protein [Bacillota bacterium]
MKKIYISCTLVGFIFLASGCNPHARQEDSGMTLLKKTNSSPIQLSTMNSSKEVQDIKKDVSSLPEIYDVAVIKGKKDTLVVYKVKHLQRFRMKKIEKKLNTLLEKKYPDDKFSVSSDYKIFLEAERLRKKIKDAHVTKKKAEKELQSIIKLKDETT